MNILKTCGRDLVSLGLPKVLNSDARIIHPTRKDVIKQASVMATEASNAGVMHCRTFFDYPCITIAIRIQ